MGALLNFSMSEASVFSEDEIRDVADGSSESIAEWVRVTAHRLGISFRTRPSDLFADAAARLSDAEVEFDEIEHLLIALERARIINAFQRGLLQIKYLR
jgi:hypothetical protein